MEKQAPCFSLRCGVFEPTISRQNDEPDTPTKKRPSPTPPTQQKRPPAMTPWKALKDPQFLSKTAWEAIPHKGILITEADNKSAHSTPVIAWCFGKEKEANARLIAAAPCL